MKMSRLKALTILGLAGAHADELDSAAVKMAYAKAVKANHPDTSAEKPQHSMAELQEAKDVLLQNVTDAGKKIVCPLCKGRGMVPGKFGARKCESCKGDTK